MADRTNPHAEIIVGATDNASKVFDKVKQSAQGMAAGVEQSATKASQSVSGIGDNAAPAAQKIDRSTKSIIASIQRATAQIEAGDRASGKFFETLAKQRGANVDALRPYLSQLDEARARQEAAAKSLAGMGMSAKQTAAAMRQVPAQITDIVVGLQGGQAPMTVLLQQGGQLKDVFGGVVPAAKALGSTIAGMVNPITLTLGAVVALGVAYRQGAAEQEAFRRSLILSGNAAGTSADALGQIAAEIDAASRSITRGRASEMLNQIAASGDVGAASLKRYAQAAIEFEQAGGGAAEEVAKAFSDIAGDPVKAVLRLNESMNFLTASTYEQIKSLQDQGKEIEAARMAADAYAGALESRIPKLEENLGYLERGWRAIKGAASEAWDSMLGVGRAATLTEQIAQVEQRVLAGRANPIIGSGYAQAKGRRAQAEDEALLSALREQKRLLDSAATADRVRAQQEKARIEWMKAGEKYLSDEVKKANAIAAAREAGLRAGQSEEEIRKRIAQIEKDFERKPKSTGGKSPEQRALEEQESTLARLSGVNADYVKQLQIIEKARESGRISEEQSVEMLNELIAKQPMASEMLKQYANEQKRAAESAAALAKAEIDRINALSRSAVSVEQQVQKLLDEEQALGLAAAMNISLAQAIEEVSIARLREQQAALMKEGDRDAEVLEIQREIDARKKLAEAIGRKETREANKKAAEDAKKEWDKTADQISQSLTDALMRGFEDGKSFGQNFADSLENMLKTQIARALQQAIAQGLSSLFSGQGFNFGSLFGGQGGFNWSSLFSGNNWASTIGSALGYGSTAGAGAGTLTYANAVGAMGGDSLGALAAANNQWAGVAASASGAAAASQSAASGMAGASSAISAIPVWGWVAIAGMALWEPLLGRKLKEYGYQVDIAGGSVDVGGYEYHKGGLFRSNKTVKSEADPRDAENLRRQVEAVRDSSAAMAKALGYSDEAIESFTGSLRINVKGAETAAEQSERYNEALQDLQRQMINAATGAEFTKEQFADFMAGIQQDMAAVGISAEGIADILVQGMMGKLSQQEVGDALADMMVGGIYESIAQNYAGQIAQAFTGQILTPIFTAIAAGVPLSQAISQQAISNVVATAQSAAAAMNAIFSNAEFKSAIAGIQQAIGGVAGAVTKVKLPKIGSVRGAASGPSPAQIEADRIAKEREGLERQLLQLQGDTAELRRRELQELAPANRALQERIWALEEEQRITQERSGLEQQLLQLQGDTTALRQLELDALDPSNRSLQERIWALEEEQRVIDERAGLQDQLNRLTLTSTQLRALELDALDPSNRALQERIWMLEDEARVTEERNGLMSTLWQMTDNVQALREKELEALDPANRALQEMIYALGDLQNAAAEAAQKTQQAWSDWGTAAALGATHLGDTSGLQALDAIVRAQISASRDPSERLAKLQELIGIEQAVGQAQQKARQDEAKALGLRQQALQQEISQAQDLLRAAKSLGDYVRNLRLGEASGLSEMDRRDALQGEYSRLLGKARGGDAEALSQLQSVSGSYLGLSQTLATSSADYSVLAGRVAAELEAVAKAQELVAQSGITAREDEIAQLTQQSELLSAQVELSDATKALITKSMIDQADVWERENNQALELLDKQAASVDALLTMPNKFGKVMGPLLAGAASTVASRIEAALAALAGPKDSESEGTVPRYAVGTNYVPRAHLAIVDEGEAIIPKAFNPWAGGQGLQGSNAELVAEVRALREQNARLESRLEAIAQSTGQMADQFDNVSAGGNALAVESM